MEGPEIKLFEVLINDDIFHLAGLIVKECERTDSSLFDFEYFLYFIFIAESDIAAGSSQVFPEGFFYFGVAFSQHQIIVIFFVRVK